MLVLEVSYLIFKYHEGQYQIIKSFTSLVKAGRMDDYPKELGSLFSFTYKQKHGLKFSICEERGLTPEEAHRIVHDDLNNCKYAFAKGAGMEKIFLGGCVLQKGYQATGHHIPVLDLDHLPQAKFSSVSQEELEKLPKCGDTNHQPKPDGSKNHCSLTDVHSFYGQLLAYLETYTKR